MEGERKVFQAGMSGEWGWKVLILQGGHGRIKAFISGFPGRRRKPWGLVHLG